MTFQPGKSGNPNGRPKGIIDKRSQYRIILENNANELIEKLVEMAKAGEPTALKLCVERLLPRIKPDNGINFNLPENGIDGGDNMLKITNELLIAVASGQMTIDEAEKFNEFLKGQRRMLEQARDKKRDEDWKKILEN